MARVDRRGFLKAGAGAVIGVAGILGGAPASWAARELSILTAVNYAPTSDAKLDELGKRFSKLTGTNVKINHVQSVQMPAKLSSELMARSGHDIMSLEMHYPWLFQPGLADVSDICTDLARKHGEWFPFLKEYAQVRGQWLGVPYLFVSFPGSHRIDLFEKVGERAPDTWDDLLRACSRGSSPTPPSPRRRSSGPRRRSSGCSTRSSNYNVAAQNDAS